MLKKTTLAVSWYTIVFILVFLLNDASPTGSFMPGIVFPVYLLLVLPGFLLPGRNINTTKKLGRDILPAAPVHAGACAGMVSPILFYYT